MNHIFNKLQTGLLAAFVTTIVSIPAVAEDIEIYQAGNLGTAAVNPNIMFILDTSGSMSATLTVDRNYDPAIDYTAAGGGCFDKDRMYPSTTSDVSCDAIFQNNYYELDQNNCLRATEAFAVTGMYNSVFAQWNDNKNFWGLLKERDNSDYVIDCKPDQGIHGDGGADLYINVNGTTPYTSDDTDEALSWGSLETESITMYTGNWMNYKISVTTHSQTRLQVMKNVISNLIYSMDDVNVGIMNYNRSAGGRVRFPVEDITANRAAMKTELDSWNYELYTPLSETLYEAYLYFTGGREDYGDVHAPTASRISVPASKVAGSNPERYKSPVDPDFAGCQKQFIIYLSDGAPTSDTGADSKIESLPGFTNTAGTNGDCIGSGNGACLDDLAGYMNRSQGLTVTLPDGTVLVPNPTDVDPGVKINTYTVGFGSNITSLKDAAREGGGEYFIAYDANDLLTTLTSIISSINDIHTTFSSPAVSVNAFNRTTHRSELYFTLFKPDTAPHWDGNFKRFKLSFDNSGVPEIIDQDNDPAVDPGTGFFKQDSMSFWTAAASAPSGDGQDTALGGAASKLFNGTPPGSGRKVYTDMGSGVLSDAANRVYRTSAGVREAMGWDGNTADTVQTDYYNKLVDWVRGIDVDDEYGNGDGGLAGGDGDTTDARPIMGDPLHAQPALVQYGGTDANPDITAYVATNDGLLHAFSTRDGVEQFAFLPPELLPKMNQLYQNVGGSKFYGLDGTVAPYIIDKNVNGIIEPGNGDKVYLYFGMRRGGSNIYPLDVTDRDNPELMWTIRGGVDSGGAPVDTSLGDYKHLGQTWSKPTVRRVRLDGNDVPVLIFGAGYDTDQDSVNVRTDDSIGRGIYIVNALDGTPMWRMGPDGAADLTDSNMDYSIPSDVAAVDTNGDGYVDHVYVGDMGGQVWRVDIDNIAGNTASNFSNVVTGGRIADLADDDIASNRRFYYPPSVAIGKDADDSAYTALVMTSGYRAHPVDRNIQDRIFMIRDTPVNGKPVSYDTVVVNNSREDLFDATSNIIGQGTTTQQDAAKVALNGADGWYINLDQSTGEKGLTKALIFAGEIYLTTYEPYHPGNETTVSCSPNEGTGYLYHIHLFDAKPVKNYDTIVSSDPDALTSEDRRVKLERSGIPADPTVITTEDGSARCVGTECEKLESGNLHKTIYWFEE